MLTNCLTDIICSTFMTNELRNQRRFGLGTHGNMMTVVFRRHIDYTVEDGYRYIELVLYAPTDYVLVAARQTWRVLDVRGLDQDHDGEWVIPKDRGYISGKGPFMVCSYHDSCWRTEGVNRVITAIESKVLGMHAPRGERWYSIVPVTDDIIMLCNDVNGSKSWDKNF